MAKTFVQLYKWLVPGWLLWGDGDGVLRSLSELVDENVQRSRDGMTRRFPSYAAAAGDDEALTKLGKARGIPRGRAEAAEHYAARLVEWRYPRGHRVRGSAFALLTQVSEYFGGVQCWTVDANGTRHGRSAEGEDAVTYGQPWTWDDRPSSEWSRFWLVVDGSSFAAARSALGVGSIGQTGLTFDDVRAIRAMLEGRAWRPAGTQGVWLVLSLDPLLGPFVDTFDASFDASFGDDTFPVPNVTWQHWSRNDAGTQVAARDGAFRYLSLDPDYTSQYAGDATNFPAAMRMPTGAIYAGDGTSIPAAVPMLRGGTYVGDATNFPAAIPLVDDGDPL